MKANEAPEKIYLYPSDRAGEEYEDEWGDRPWGDSVEYTRTDAFIEKAEEFLYKKLNNSEMECGNIKVFINDFIKHIKG